ncbi:RICIN domain-containing protein [Paenibacillus harenae]|uniref:RICIN domain-containing protein n=1 Tax=Paenibacillus harenae TaxID=306543 RepID=UPI000416BD38|nr:RICIN domain-containing protein [Paenibacillus harenae]
MKKILAFSMMLCLLVSMAGNVREVEAATTGPFVHPGILHTQADFDRMTQMVDANVQPYRDGYDRLASSPLSASGWTPRATETIIRGGTGDNVALLYIDVARAFQNAVRWKVTGIKAHGDTAVNILNAWSSTLTTVTGNADRYLAAGLFGYQLANASEIMRDYPGFNVTQMQDMLLNVFYKPLNERFLIGNEFGDDHNGAYIQNYWANWDLCNMAATVAIGIFTDRRDIYDIGIEYFKNGAGNGSIYNAIPFLHPGGLAQWQESGRDQPHSVLGIGLMAATAEMAWNQGDDLYGWANNRFLRAAEYVAKYNNGDDNVPFATYEWGSGVNGSVQRQTVISSSGRGDARPVWAMIYNHYANRKGLSVPNIAARVQLLGTEGGPNANNNHASTFDQPGYGTLLYTRPAGSGGTATLSDGNIPGGTYRFIVRHSGKAMDTAGTTNGAAVQQWTSNGGTNQQWIVTHLGGGQYSVRDVRSGRSLDVANASLDHTARFQLWSYHGGDNQRFAFIPVGEGYHRITPVHSNKPVDVDGVSTADGALLQQWRYVLGGNQQWTLEPVSVNVRLQSHNFPDRYVRHSNNRARIDADVSPVQDAQFRMVAGLADSRGVSFESVNFPGRYLRVRSNGEVWLDSNDSTTAFANDATFRRVAGLADAQKSSYQMWMDSTRYLRHQNNLLYAQIGSGALFEADATFTEIAP